MVGDHLVNPKQYLQVITGKGSFPGFYRERSFRVAFDTMFTVPYVEGWDGMASLMHTEEITLSRQNNQSFPMISQGPEL
ncbi:MAG: hypothetical protein CM1200mP40_06780 [Gammaproteobacteria bacterium]|nr:MAG: hypothetical protein CM1200mP40_06780 [Gammaproteobacteria bacterium]